MFDLVRHLRSCGHLSNVATVLTELAEVIEPDKMQDAAAKASIPEVQRAGYLLELVGQESPADSLAEFLSARRVRTVLLRPDGSPERKSFDERWRLVINEEVEPDL